MTTNRVTTYSADECTLTFCGRPINSGYADGEFVSIKMNAKAFMTKKGTDGETARAKSNNRGATMTIKLMHTSKGNNVLSAIHNMDISRPGGAGVGVWELRDNSGGLVAHADKAWITGFPDQARGREVGEVEWEFECGQMDLTVDGNESI